MNRKFYFMTLAAASLFASACSNNEITPAATGEAIEFRAVIDKTDVTRASQVGEPKELTSIFVQAGLKGQNDLEFMNSAVWRSEDGWAYAPKKYFPNDGTAINFYAYAPIKDFNMVIENDTDLQIETSTGSVSFKYTVPSGQSANNTAVDLLVASALEQTSGPVTLTFEHALSGVTFSAWNQNPVDGELVYVIHEIGISDLATTGTFTYPSSWSDWSGPQTYTAGVPAAGVAVLPSGSGDPANYVKLLSANDIMMVLPQTIQGSSNVSVVFSLRDGEGVFIYDNYTINLPLPSGFEFVAGTIYDFQFKFTTMGAIEFSVGLSDWKNESIEVPATNP